MSPRSNLNDCESAELTCAYAAQTARQWVEPEWEQVAPGIECKLLATDTERHRVSTLVRLAPGARYPAHTHADVEELHLLDGFPTPYKSKVSPYLLGY